MCGHVMVMLMMMMIIILMSTHTTQKWGLKEVIKRVKESYPIAAADKILPSRDSIEFIV